MADDKTRARVAALLAKARSTEHEGEAQAFLAKAAELMAREGLTEEDLATGNYERGVRMLKPADIWSGPYGDIRMAGLARIGKVVGVYVVGRFEDVAHATDPVGIDLVGREDLISKTLAIWEVVQLQADRISVAKADAMPRRRSWQVVQTTDWQVPDFLQQEGWRTAPGPRLERRLVDLPPEPEEYAKYLRSVFYGFVHGCAEMIEERLATPAEPGEMSLHPVLATEYDKAHQTFDELLESIGVDPEAVTSGEIELDRRATAVGSAEARTSADLNLHETLEEHNEPQDMTQLTQETQQ